MKNQEAGYLQENQIRPNEKKPNLALKWAQQTDLYKKELAEIEEKKQARIEQIKAETRQRKEKLFNDYISANNEDDKKWEDEWEWKKTMVCELPKEEFIKVAIDLSREIHQEYWIPWTVVLWQVLLESGDWQSRVAKKYNNVFWHRAKWGKWRYSYVAFASLEDSFEAYAENLSNSWRYAKAFNHKDNPIKFLTEINNAWYSSTNSREYVSKVQWRLNQYWVRLEDWSKLA